MLSRIAKILGLELPPPPPVAEEDIEGGGTGEMFEFAEIDESMMYEKMCELERTEEEYIKQRVRRGMLAGYDPTWDWRLTSLSGATVLAEHHRRRERRFYGGNERGGGEDEAEFSANIRQICERARGDRSMEAIDLPAFTHLSAVALLNDDVELAETLEVRPVAPGAWLWAIEFVDGTQKSLVVADASSELVAFAVDLFRCACACDDFAIGRLRANEMVKFQTSLMRGVVENAAADGQLETASVWGNIEVADYYTTETYESLIRERRDEEQHSSGGGGGVFNMIRRPKMRRFMDAIRVPLARFFHRYIARDRLPGEKHGSDRQEEEEEEEQEDNNDNIPLADVSIDIIDSHQATTTTTNEDDADEIVQYVWIKFPGIVRLYELYVNYHEPSIEAMLDSLRKACAENNPDRSMLMQAAEKHFRETYPLRNVHAVARNDMAREAYTISNAIRLRLGSIAMVDTPPPPPPPPVIKDDDGDKDNENMEKMYSLSYEWFMQCMKKIEESGGPEDECTYRDLFRALSPQLARVFALGQTLAASYVVATPSSSS